MKIIDAKRLECPKPLILTKRALKKTSDDLMILIDNETSMQNVKKFLIDNKVKVSIEKKAEVYHLKTQRSGDSKEILPAEDYCKIPVAKGNHVYVFKNFGVAQDELGKMLTNGFLDTICEVEPLPAKIIFYHEGAKLTTEGSPVIDKLQKLEKLGVELLICGNCLQFYGLTEKVEVGIVSNAYTILKAMTDAHHLIYP